MQQTISHQIQKRKQQGHKSLAVLLDPDKVNLKYLQDFVHDAMLNGVDYFFVGGSLIANYQLKELVLGIKTYCDLPVVLFPGNSQHIVSEADGILFLSLISGRNAEYLIGQQVIAAPILKQAGLEILPTGYILIDGGTTTTVQYISNTSPIPRDKAPIAACTALAGQMMGQQQIYLDAGSGAILEIPDNLIAAVKAQITCPLIVGGGINTAQKALTAWQAGADIVVVGNKLEQDPNFINELGEALKQVNQAQKILV
jgi:phosphoglycerol geranylgeranyltransferase